MSYRLAQIFLRDAFPGGRPAAPLPGSSIKVNVQAVGQRLELEVQRATSIAAAATPSALSGPPVALQIVAGYIKAPCQADGSGGSPSQLPSSFGLIGNEATPMLTRQLAIRTRVCDNKASWAHSESDHRRP